MRKLTALSVLLTGMIATASAGDCANGVCLTPNVQTVITTPVANAFTLPIYGAAYQPASTTGDDDTKALLKALIDEVRALRADIAKGSTGQPSALSVPKEIDPVTVLKTACASCHTGEKSKGGFALYTDKNELVRLSPADRREVSKRVSNGNMPPPPGKLTTEQKDAVLRAMK